MEAQEEKTYEEKLVDVHNITMKIGIKYKITMHDFNGYFICDKSGYIAGVFNFCFCEPKAQANITNKPFVMMITN